MRSLQPKAWEEHEHLTPPIQVQAQRLLEEAGSPELAKHAVDAAAEQQSHADDLLTQGGFASWDEMLTFSTSIDFDGEQWWITPFREQEGWMLWSQRGRSNPQFFASFEEAHRHLLHQS